MNKLAECRKKAGKSQRELARLVGVSQPTIQRIEAGVGPVRLETALQIARVLNVPPHRVFPALSTSGAVRAGHGTAAVDASGASHTIEVKFSCGRVANYSTDMAEAARVMTALAHGDQAFVQLETDDARVVVLASKAICWARHLEEPGMGRPHGLQVQDSPTLEAADENAWTMTVYFEGIGEPQTFDVEPDTADGSEEENADRTEAQLQQMLFDLDTLSPGDGQAIAFWDGDGERVVIPLHRLQSLELPLAAVNVAAYAAWQAGQEEGDEEQGVA